MKKIIARAFICLVTLSIFLSTTIVLATSSEAGKVIKIGYFLLNGYHVVDADNGYKSGYGYDYLQNMKVYTGHEYDYIGDDEAVYWGDMLNLLESGEIDLLTSVSKTPERMEKFDFSTLPMGNKSAILVVDADNSMYEPTDYTNWDGIRVGMMKDNAKNEPFKKFAQDKDFSYETVYVENDETHTDLLESGKVDAILTSDLYNPSNKQKIIAKFDSTPFYACVKKGNETLLKEVNSAILSINNQSPYLKEKLRERYYPLENGSQIQFTAQEREFIEKSNDEGRVFKALISSDQEPFSHYVNGDFVGSNVEITQEIIARTGLTIEYIQSKSVQDYIKCIEAGEADIILDSIFGYNACERYGYIPSNPYYNATVSSLSKKNNNQSKIEVVALVESLDYRKSTVVRNTYSYQEVISCQNTKETIKMVDEEKVDATYLFTVVAEQAVRQDPKNSMVTTVLPKETVDFSVAVHQDQNTLLSSIFSKASASLSEEDIVIMSQPYLGIELRPITFTTLIYENPMAFTLLAGIVVMLVCMIAIAILAYKSKCHKEQLNLKLTRAVAMADKASNDKSRFLAQMSHEIRTPMNAIIGLTSIAKAEIDEPDKVKSNLNKISSSSRILLRIINDILDMSAIEGGKMKIDHIAFDFKKLIFDVTAMFYQQTKQNNIEFNIHMSSVINETLVGDELRSQQILMNLLSNAGKFTGAGGKIDLRIVETSQSQDRVHIRYILTDTGCGMSEDMQSRIFQPFEQQDASTAKKHGGSGLGLSITKNLVDLMGGSIQVKSVEGQGCTFIVDIPYTRSEDKVKSTNDCFSEVRTLVIESQIGSNDYISSLLSRLLVPHDFAPDQEKAMEMLGDAEEDGSPYKLCLIDLNIPDIDGLEFTKTLREVFGNDDLVIMVLAYDLEEIELLPNSKTVNYFVHKPLFQSTVVDALMQIVGGAPTTIGKTTTGSYDFSGKKVLIAEDVELNLEVAIKLLKLVHLEVDFAIDGKAAVEIFDESPSGTYDCILMDINMPIMNGYEATRVIRAMDHPDAKTIPIYAMTANAFSEDIKTALDTGMDGHIAKPIETKILYQTLQKALYGGKNE